MSRTAIALTALLTGALLASAACNSSSTNVLGPSGTKCGISLPSSVPTIASGGGAGTLTVTVAAECVWSASSEADWIAITENANGQGSGVVKFVASGNPTASMRKGSLIVGEARVELAQGGAPCQYTLTPPTQSVGTDGGEGSVSVAVIDGCQWTATSNASWLSVLGTPSGTGAGTVRYRAERNTGSSRSGALTIGDRTFAVNQAGTGAPCSVSLGQSEQFVAAAGGDDVVAVTAAADCPWTATSLASWITVTSGATGSGSGAVRLSIVANAGAQRVGLVTITGHTYVVTQAGATGTCSYSIGATAQAVPAAASTGSIVVSASNGCPWTAISQAPWITVTGGNTGTGGGVVTLAIAANTGAERVGRVSVAGFTYTVTQDAVGATPCSYAIDTTQFTAPAAATTSAVNVTATAGCSWTAASQVGWITVTSGASGSGNGTVNMTVAANTGAARTGAVSIAGQTYTVTQPAAAPTPPPACSYSISSSQLAAPASGASSAVNVTAGTDCSWTATSGAGWVTVASGASGTGNGTVNVAVAANTGASRTGTVTIAGQAYTVTQAAGSTPCSYDLGADEQTATAVGGPATVAVTASSGCSWTAAGQVPWITVATGASGSGNGTVVLTVAINTGAERVGTALIAGHTHTIRQAAAPLACSYSLSATDKASPAAGEAVSIGVTAGGGCSWTAASQVSWIAVTSGANGSGNGSVQLTIAPNAAAQRVGTVTIAGHTFTVTQAAAGCSYSINPTSQTVSLLGGSFSVEITTQAWCTWTATTGDSWIQIASATTGLGNGTLTYNVPLVSLGLLFSRTGTITISGTVLTVNQQSLLLNAR